MNGRKKVYRPKKQKINSATIAANCSNENINTYPGESHPPNLMSVVMLWKYVLGKENCKVSDKTLALVAQGNLFFQYLLK